MRLPAIVIILISTLIIGLSIKVLLNEYFENDNLTSSPAINLQDSGSNNTLSESDNNPTPSLSTPAAIPTPSKSPATTSPNNPTPSPSINAEYVDVYVTYYGWHDNAPSGNKIASPKKYFNEAKHDTAGGKGTYDDPITFASDKELFEVGTVLYVPYIKKYIVMEDQCSTCEDNYDDGRKHIDIWMSSNDDYEDELYECQRYWTRNKTKVEINPPKNREVNLAPLFDKENGECLKTI